MRVVLIVFLDPFSKSFLELIEGFPFPGPDQILLDGSYDAFSVCVPFGIAIAGENLMEAKGLGLLHEGLRSRLAAMVADQV